jgi:DNA-binding MarR family transcriptional regulator
MQMVQLLIISYLLTTLDHLLEKGYINMTEDENDHRIMRITLTQDSYKVINRVNDVYEQCKNVLLRGISDEEMHIFRKIIHKMNNNVDEELLM